MIDANVVKAALSDLSDIEVDGKKVITILPPSKGEPGKIRIYAMGGLLAKIGIVPNAKEIEMMDSRYANHLKDEGERECLIKYLKNVGSDANRGIATLKDAKFQNLAFKAMLLRNQKKSDAPKEKNVQENIVQRFMGYRTDWKVLAQEAQFRGKDFLGGNFSEGTTEKERFDLIVVADRGLGFVELKVNNENCNNLNSHYEHMQYVRKHPETFIADAERRFKIVKDYGLWPNDDMEKFTTENLWFGFLFIAGDKARSKEIVRNFFGNKSHDEDETFYLYHDINVFELDINDMMSYEEFMKS